MSATGRIMSPPLVEFLQRQRADLLARTELASGLTQLPPQQLDNTLIASDFVVAEWVNHPSSLQWLVDGQTWKSALSREQLAAELQEGLRGCETEAMLKAALRCFRNRHMVRLIWRDANNLTSLETLTRELSWLAQLSLSAALGWLYQQLADKGYGYPVGSHSKSRQQLVVLGMGKLGAGELNLSSDIDLIFLFSEAGQTDGSEPLDNQEFFARLGKKLIQVIDQQTADGFVFRVDMRLRPYGSSGPLAMSFSAARNYYEAVGRDWERYALVKARAIAGDIEQGNNFLSSIKPFVYRRYLDFTVKESIREMKQLINREVKRQSNENNIKVGYGGIREVEFVVQSLQLIYGGKEQELQLQNFNEALAVLFRHQYLSSEAYQELLESYQFLRRLEHGLQAVADRQTQMLPADELTQRRLAWVLGFSDWAELLNRLTQVRERVRVHFEQLLLQEDAVITTVVGPEVGALWAPYWQQLSQHRAPQENLLPTPCVTALQRFLHSFQVRRMTKRGRQRLDQIMPMMLEQIAIHHLCAH